MFDPDANPKKRQNVMINPSIALLSIPLECCEESTVAGSHRASDEMAHTIIAMIMVLNRPSLSAMYPGAHCDVISTWLLLLQTNNHVQ